MWQKKLKSVKPQTFENRLGGLKIYLSLVFDYQLEIWLN